MDVKRIFLVDDEQIINAIQYKIVNQHFPGLEVTKYNSAEEILKLLPELDSRVIIFLDLNMPVMDAVDFLKSLDALDLKVLPVIYILTYSQNPEEIEFVKKHELVKRVFSKPLSEENIDRVKKDINS